MPHKHRLGRKRAVAVTALAAEPFIVVARHAAPGLYDQIETVCRRAGFKPAIAQQATEIQTIVGLVSAGTGNRDRPGVGPRSAGRPRASTAR